MTNIGHTMSTCCVCISAQHEVAHWYRNETFLKSYDYFLQSIPNMKMWPHTIGIVVEPPSPKVMPDRPRRQGKDEPRKKYEKLSKKGAKMTCSNCHQVGHNKKACQLMAGMGQSRSRQQPSSQQPPMSGQPSSSSQPPVFSNQPTMSSQPVFSSQPSSSSQPPVFSSQPAMSRQPSSSSQQDSSICFDTSAVRRQQQSGRGTGIGTSTGRGGVSSQQPDISRDMKDSTSTRRQKRVKTVGFGIFTNANSSQTFNPGTLGERVITLGPYKDASQTNIDIGYKA